MECFTVSVTDHVARLTLAVPTMGAAFFRELPAAITALDADPEVRAIVIAGAGGRFSYGLDLRSMSSTFLALVTDGSAAARAACPHRGPGAAGVDHRRRRLPDPDGRGDRGLVRRRRGRPRHGRRRAARERRRALLGARGADGHRRRPRSLQRLVGLVGDGHLRELALTGADVDAARAERIGLVNDVYADEAALLTAADALAASMAANSPLVTRGIKDVLDAERGPRVEAGLRYVAAWNSAFLASADLTEALTAFQERREPEFRGA